MTRKDYLLLSSALARTQDIELPDDLHEAAAQHRADCLAIAEALQRENPHGFDAARFLADCGL